MPWDADKTWRDVALDIVRGVTNREHFDLTTIASNVTSTEALLASGTGTPNPFGVTAATTVRIRAGGNAADTATGPGVGATAVQIQGIVEEGGVWRIDQEVLITAGAAASAPSANTYRYVWLMGVQSVGTRYTGPLTGANVGTIVLETVGGVELLTMLPGEGVGTAAFFVVPDGFDAVLIKTNRFVDGTKAATLKLFRVDQVDLVAGPTFGPQRLLREDIGLRLAAPTDTIPLGRVPPRSALLWTGDAAAATTAATVTMEIVLFPRQEGQ